MNNQLSSLLHSIISFTQNFRDPLNRKHKLLNNFQGRIKRFSECCALVFAVLGLVKTNIGENRSQHLQAASRCCSSFCGLFRRFLSSFLPDMFNLESYVTHKRLVQCSQICGKYSRLMRKSIILHHKYLKVSKTFVGLNNIRNRAWNMNSIKNIFFCFSPESKEKVEIDIIIGWYIASFVVICLLIISKWPPLSNRLLWIGE